MAIYEFDLCSRFFSRDGKQIVEIPKIEDFGPDDEVYEIVHVDDVQLSAIEQEPVSVEPSDLKKARFRVDPADKFRNFQRQIQAMGAHAAKYMRDNAPVVEPEDAPVA